MNRMIRKAVAATAAVGCVASVALGVTGCDTRYGASLARPSDPIVLTGSKLPKLLGSSPRHIVGFAWDGSDWHQIPVQVDERDLVSPGQIYHLPPSAYPTLYGTSTPYKIPVYTPPATTDATYQSTPTYTPPDSNPNLDGDDEVAFLASDTGSKATAAAGVPDGVVASTWQEVTATDPLHAGQIGYVYLFRSNTLTGGSGGTTGVQYEFSLSAGDYLSEYRMANGALPPNNSWGFNPEDSTIQTPFYTQNYADRWLNDALTMPGVGSSGSDLLDRSKYFATSQGCSRTEDTFDGADTGEGAFVVNIVGPVRAIRSYLGANSFKFTAATDVFYPRREDTTIELRGHAGMPGFGQSDDWTTGMTGLTYSDPANVDLPIDGVPDAFTPITSAAGDTTQPARWQLVRSPAGAVVTTRTVATSISDLVESSTYRDDVNPATPPCTGDGSYWGEAGFTTVSPTQSVPATDPTLTATPETYVAQRFRYFTSADTTRSDAAELDARARNPIVTTIAG